MGPERISNRLPIFTLLYVCVRASMYACLILTAYHVCQLAKTSTFLGKGIIFEYNVTGHKNVSFSLSGAICFRQVYLMMTVISFCVCSSSESESSHSAEVSQHLDNFLAIMSAVLGEKRCSSINFAPFNIFWFNDRTYLK